MNTPISGSPVTLYVTVHAPEFTVEGIFVQTPFTFSYTVIALAGMLHG